PFPGGSSLEKMVRHNSEKPLPVYQLRSDVSLEISAIIQRLVEKDASRRFQTPLELAKALEPHCKTDSGSLEALHTTAAAWGATAANAPWADLMDEADPSALAGTIPVHGSQTPTPSSLVLRGLSYRRWRPSAKKGSWLVWMIGVAALAMATGLAV